MKRIFLGIIMILCVFNIEAQNQDPTLDVALNNVNQSAVSSGIIYERTMQLANLYNFNREEGFNVANYKYFKQALLEMHNASNKNLFVNLDQLDGQLEQEAQNIVPIGILNTDFQLLNYNMDNETLGGLLYNEDTKRFSQINGRPPFYTLHTTVIAPLKKAVSGNNIIYKINSSYFYQNQQQKIKTLTANFGDGINRTLISNQQLIAQQITVSYSTSGIKTATYQVTYEDNSSLTTYSTLYFKKTQGLQKSIGLLCAGTQGLGTTKNDTLQAAISFQGYNNDPSDPNRDPTIKAKIQYRTYFADNNSTGIVNNPIIILDGFDPGDKRKIEDCDCENDADCKSDNLDNDDNFNGGDYESIVDLQDFDNNQGNPTNVLETLRTEGFDVIIVNHPTYKTDDLNTPNVDPEEVTIDGGAYYIESNAFALVKLLQLTKQELSSNGSTAQIKLIGPSMGGQIAKYALSYMEKQEELTGDEEWDHNVSHYVSFDSPHLGANIPLGDQALLYLLSGESAAAKEFYEEELASPASRQQLIEFHQPKMVDVLGIQVPSNSQVQQSLLNARTISQGFSQNRGDDFFQLHYNNQFNNGVSGSNGFPLKTVNLAVVNGSLTGSTLTDYVENERAFHFAPDGERVFSARAMMRVKIQTPFGVIVFRVQVASLDSHFMPSTGSSDKKIARFSNIRSSEKVTKAPNFNNRGNMDNVPGGFYDVQGQLQSAIDGEDSGSLFQILNISLLQQEIWGINGTSLEYRFSENNNPINSFIPTFSAIAHLNPDQDWGNPLDFDLTCESNILTPFDSYYGESLNTAHVSFNQKSIDWLLGNFALDVGDVLAPVFPIDTASFSSPDTMCVGDIVTIGFEDECKVASAPTYIVHSDNLRIVSQNGYSAQVEALSNGVGYIQVNISNSVGPSQGFGRQIHVGTPNLDNAFVTEIDSGTFLSLYPPNNFCDLVALRIDGIERFDLVDEIEMQKLPTSIAYWDGDQRTGRDNTVGIYPNCNELFRFQVRARNACGWSEWVEFVKDIDGCSNDCSTTSSSNIVSNNFIISPVPASTIIAIDMIQDPQWTFYTKACSDGIADLDGTTHCTYFVSIQLYDFSGNQVLNISHHELGTSFDISHLTTGTYVMHVSHGGQTEIHQIPIN